MSFRKANETKEDLLAEESAKLAIERAFNCKVHKLSPMLYGVDRALASRAGNVRCFAEFKRRAKKYDTLIISFGKIAKARTLVEASGVPFALFIEWPDGIFYWTYRGEQMMPALLGRVDRGQNGDMEPMVSIPVSEFRRIPYRAQ